ncbi:bif family protein [Megaselia abdita]
MSQGAGVQCTSSPSASSSPTSTTTAVIPQWKLELLQRRKTNNCPKTIGALPQHHQQSLTHLKHANNTCISDSLDSSSSNNSGGSSKKTSSPTHPSTDTVMMIKSPIHEHKQLVGHGNDEKPFQLQSNSEHNLSQSHSQSQFSAFNENNRKLFKKSCESSAGFTSSNIKFQNSQALKSKKKMVAVQEITDTITKELDTFDSTEEFQYGPGIVSKLRYRYLTLTLRQNAQKQRSNLDSLRRATSLNNLLDHDDDDDDDVDEEDVCEEEEVAATKENKQPQQQQQQQHQQNNNHQQQQPSSVVHKYLKQNQSSVHFNSSVEQQQQQRSARQIKRGNDTLKRARSVEALLCDNNSRFNSNNNNSNNNRNSWNDSKSYNNNSVTIEDKIHNARERNLLSLDKIPKRLTSIIDDTERPPPDLVKQTLKMFEATANRRGGPNRKANGDVAAKIANYKSIISQEKPIIIYPKPTSPKKSPMKLKIDSPISNMVRKFTPTTEEPPFSPPQSILENNLNLNLNSNLNSKPDIIPRKHSTTTKAATTISPTTTSPSCESPVSELTKKINSLSIQTKATTTSTTTNSVSEQNSYESDGFVVDVDENKGTSSPSETDCSSSSLLSTKRISKSALDNISKAGTTQHFSFRSTPPTTTPKQIGVIRPIVAEVSSGDDNNGFMNLTPQKEKIPLTSREIQKNMINDKKREEATASPSSQQSSPAWLNAIKKNNGNNATAKNNNHGQGDNNTMVFNFKDRKEVPDYIENDGLLIRKRRELPKPNESGFVLLSDTCLDTSTDTDEIWQQMGPPSPCDVEFINANIIIDGKSSIRNRSTKELHYRVQFNDSLTSTFEYPSESSILEDGDTVDNYNHHSSHGDIMDEDTSQFSSTGKMLGNLSLEQVVRTASSRPNVLKNPQYAKFLQNDSEEIPCCFTTTSNTKNVH